MASKRLLDKRREHEAAEKQGKLKKEASSTTAKKGTRKVATRKRKVKAPERKRLMWGVFTGTLKEEGRFAYDERDKAEEKLALLRAKSKKLYFIQPIKESLNASTAAPEEVHINMDDDELVDEDNVIEEDDDDGEVDEFDDEGEEE